MSVAPSGLRTAAPSGRKRCAFTLVELLVVLVILAVLTVVAVQATESLMEQGRFDSTQRTLTAIEEAIVGPANLRQPDGTLMISGFVADMGRPPTLIGADPDLKLRELWDSSGMVPFAMRPAPTDGEVIVPSGWRGPYLRLPLGLDRLKDGWGRSFDLSESSGNLAVLSLGANNAAGGNGFDLDSQVSIPQSRYAAQIAGQVRLVDQAGNPRDIQSGATLTVVLFGPDPASGGPRANPLTPTPSPGNQGVYQFLGTTTIGPRVIRAYETGGASPYRSRVVYLAVPPGGITTVLEIKGAAAAPSPPP